MLQLHDVTVRYGATAAVDGVSVDVGDGEVLALLGPSGCGKSTLLRAIVGIEPLAAGRIEWDGVDLARVPVHRRGFGLMFQDGVLFPHRTVAGNVGYGLTQGMRKSPDATERVTGLLEMVGLAGYGRRRVATLSGGEAQRVALARALAPRPRLLLLDEPLAALDMSLRSALLSDLDDVLRSTGTTAIFVTHDQGEAFAIADRVALMRAGRIVQIGTPREVWDNPVDAAAAQFLGLLGRSAGQDRHAMGSRPDRPVRESAPLVVVAGAVMLDGKLLVAQRSAPPELAGKWELPGGKVEAGESGEAALERELAEELGLRVRVGPRIGPAIELGAGRDGRSRELHVYRAEPSAGEASHAMRPTVHTAVRWVTAGELAEIDWVPADRLLHSALAAAMTSADGVGSDGFPATRPAGVRQS